MINCHLKLDLRISLRVNKIEVDETKHFQLTKEKEESGGCISIHSPEDFFNGSFDRALRYESEAGWTSRLSYWSRELDGGTVGTEVDGTKTEVVKTTGKSIVVDNYVGYIKGNGISRFSSLFGKY